MPALQPKELLDENSLRAGALLLRTKILDGIGRSSLDPEQGSNQRHRLREILCPLVQQHLDLMPFLLVGIVGCEPGSKAEMLQHRPKWGAGVMRRALIT